MGRVRPRSYFSVEHVCKDQQRSGSLLNSVFTGRLPSRMRREWNERARWDQADVFSVGFGTPTAFQQCVGTILPGLNHVDLLLFQHVLIRTDSVSVSRFPCRCFFF